MSPSRTSRSKPPAPRDSRPRTPDLLLNLGERTSERLRAVGIPDEATLRAVGATEAYRRLKAAFPQQVSAVALYALHGALTNTHWNDFPPEVKAQMRAMAEEQSATRWAGTRPSPPHSRARPGRS